jgi:hypothetical protein
MTFVIDGVEKTAYVHDDAEPAALGLRVLRWLRQARHHALRDSGDPEQALPALAQAIRQLRSVTSDHPPSPADIARLREFANTHVSSGSLEDWHVLLRDTQGDPALILAAGVIEHHAEFPQASNLAGCGYVIDLDNSCLEVYHGLQTRPHSRGRFAGRPPVQPGWHPVALHASWPLNSLPPEHEFTTATALPDDDDTPPWWHGYGTPKDDPHHRHATER